MFFWSHGKILVASIESFSPKKKNRDLLLKTKGRFGQKKKKNTRRKKVSYCLRANWLSVTLERTGFDPNSPEIAKLSIVFKGKKPPRQRERERER